MRVVHNLAWYFPDASGGTEVYVDGLVTALKVHGVDGYVLAATRNKDVQKYTHNDVEVTRYPVPENHVKKVIRGNAPHAGFDVFAKMLVAMKPDIFHLHSLTPDSGFHHLSLAKSIGIPTVLTVHVPNLSCMRGTMMRLGEHPCDGLFMARRCTRCVAQSRGVSSMTAHGLSYIPMRMSRIAMNHIHFPRIGSALAMKALVEVHNQRFREACQIADRVVVLSQWMRRSLETNGLSRRKLALCRHGVGPEFNHSDDPSKKARNGTTLGIIARADPVKGIHTAIKGFKKLKRNSKMELYIHALIAGTAGQAYYLELKRLAGDDPRIHFEPPLSREALPYVVKRFDLLLVPSECLETGPLVVLEALASKVPVYGSRLGGIEEHVQDGTNGRLLEPGKDELWGRALQEIEEFPEILEFYKKNIGKVRSTMDVASDMNELYAELLR